jgi:hypothetical protein
MKTYARIQEGVVAELLKTDNDITTMFVPSLLWVDVSSDTGIREGWRYDGKSFAAPAAIPAPPSIPTLADLQSQLTELSVRITALSGKK